MTLELIKAKSLSFAYRWARWLAIKKVYREQKRQGKPRNLEAVIAKGDARLIGLSPWYTNFSIPQGLETEVYGMKFYSPLILSSFKDDIPVIERWLELGLGGACLKTTLKEDRDGNKEPRIQEVYVDGYHGLFNALGLPGKGVIGKIHEIRESTLFHHGKPIGLSIGGSSLDEYKLVFDAFNIFMKSQIDNPPFYYEINISCPNTEEGQQMQNHPYLLEDLLTYMRDKTDAAIFVKLSPDMKDQQLLNFADMIKTYFDAGINLGNTQLKTCAQVNLPNDAISMGRGGYSGPGIYPRTKEMAILIRDKSKYNNIDIISTGGIDIGEKAHYLLDNIGVNLIGMTTAVVDDMYCIPKINNKIIKLRG